MSDIDENAALIKRAYDRSYRRKNAEAIRAYERAYYAKNTDKMREQARQRYREETPEQRKARDAYLKEWVKNNREARLEIQRRYREKHRAKLREANREYTKALPKQRKQRILEKRAIDRETLAGRPRPEVCDACGGPPDPKKGLHFDHCHTYGHFRGWLCRECNLALGNVRDDANRLLKLVAYLKRTKNGPAKQLDLQGV